MSQSRIASLSRRILLLLVALAVAPAASAAEDLAEVLDRFDAVQDEIETLSAEFTETTTHSLLKDPIEAEGRFFLTKPNAIRWEYSSPEEMKFVIAENQYTGYFPRQKRAEKRNIQRWADHLFRFFGLGQGSKELSKFYNISLADAQEDDDRVLLLLHPKKKRARKRVQEVRFFLGRSNNLPVRVEYLSKGGDTRVIEFRDIQVNPSLAANLYSVDIPADVKVTNGFSGLPNLTPESTQ
ncbi:MAG: outer membrane lipoprotein carrier protein LolA [bacterium]|nr:outer membrane lipoprotein carrier protein LolA [bacterium]